MKQETVLLLILTILVITITLSSADLIPLVTSPTPTALPTRHVPANALVIKNGMVIDGTGDEPIKNGLVVLVGDKISAIGPVSDFFIPPETKIIDAKGGTIMPGIINSHVHETASALVRQFYYLNHGVTTVCDLGTPISAFPRFRESRAQGYGLTARGFYSGPIINVRDGYPGNDEFLYPITNTISARNAVVDLVGQGADMIKIALDTGNSKLPWPATTPYSIPTMTLDELKALTDQAHASHRLVRVHIGMENMLDLALDSGVDVLEHVPLPTLDHIDFTKETADHFPTLAPSYEAKLARAVQNRMIMVPTLDYIISWCESFAMTNERKVLCSKYALTTVHRFHQMGGVIGLGNDALGGTRGKMPVPEMQLLLQAGLTPMQVIQAGTQVAARVCGHADDLGTLEPGKLADVIVVNGNPLNNIRVMEQVTTVILGGQVVRTTQ